MKTKSFKLILPIVSIIFAVGGSFVTSASEKSKLAVIPGYAPLAATENFPACSLTTNCSDNTMNPICTRTIGTITFNAFGKIFPQASTCPIVLYKAD